MRRPWLVVTVLLAVAAAGLLVWAGRGGGRSQATAVAAQEDFRVLVEATGSLEAAVYFEIGPPSVQEFWQYNLTWMTPEGSRVKKGQVVARFDAQQLEDRLREQQAEMEKVVREKEKAERDLEIQLRQLRLDLVEARAEIEKVAVEASVPEELVPALELAQTRMREKLARQRAEFLEAKMRFQEELVRSKLELLEVKKTRTRQKIDFYTDARDKFQVKAPIDGVVLYVPKPNGQRWEVGEGVWMLAKILKVADVSTLQVEAQVLEVDAARVAPGQPVEVVLDALPGRTLSSRVAEVGQIVHARSPQDPSKVFDAFIPLPEVDTDLMRPGMSVRVAVEIQRLAGSITVPLQAVRAGPEGTYVQVVEGPGGSRTRIVELGPRNRDRVVVLSGLKPGERVLLAGPEPA